MKSEAPPSPASGKVRIKVRIKVQITVQADRSARGRVVEPLCSEASR